MKLATALDSITRVLHHGTMLINVDLKALGRYLNPSKPKLESKGIKSVVSRVMNINDFNPEINHCSLS